jgi:hypothetical protein
MDITKGSGNTADCLLQIQKAGWPSARTILTYQSFDAFRVSGAQITSGAESGPLDSRRQAADYYYNNESQPAGPAHSPEDHDSAGAPLAALGGSCDGCVPGSSEGEGLLLTLGRLLTEFAVTVTYWGTANVTLQGPYAGVLGWPAQCGGSLHRCWPAMDQANLALVIKGSQMQ